jgi:large subunit ribosomal protein L24
MSAASTSARMRLTRILSAASPGKRRPKPVVEAAKNKKRWNIVRGDRVQVIGDHPEKGKQGKVLTVLRKQDRVIVEGINVATKYIKGDPERNIPGRSVQQERSLPYHAVNLVDPVTNLPTRISYSFLEDGTKVRIAKKSGAVIPKPDILRFRTNPVRSHVTDSDTIAEDVWAITLEDFVPPSPKQKQTK